MSENGRLEIGYNENGGLYKRGKGDEFNESGSLNFDKLNEIINNDTIQNSSSMKWLSRFSRFGYVDPYNTPKTHKEYIFITKPDLHLFENHNVDKINSEISNNVFFLEEFNRYRHIMRQLQYSVDKSQPYLSMLQSSVVSSLELPDIVGLESETNENIYGDKLSYRHGSESGDVGFDFSLEFSDTHRFEIYHLFKMWDMYYEMKTKGRITPPSSKYITNMELHDQVSIYKIIVGEDYETIKWYSKLYGVYPKGVPRSTFGSLDDGPVKLNIDFRAAFVIDNEPPILQELNYLATIGSSITSVKSLKAAPIWDSSNKKVSTKWVGKPFVILDKNVSNGDDSKGCNGVYKLKWRAV